MQFLPLAVAAAVASVQLSPLTPGVVRSDPVLVRAVVDGSTIDVAGIGRVRLLGIDAPDLGRRHGSPAPFAIEARDRLTSLVLHRWVRLEHDGRALDSNSRHAVYVLTEDGVFVNAALVRDGFARVTARAPQSRLADLQRAEADAQAARRGMWGATPQLPVTGYTRPSGVARSPAHKRKQPAQHPKATKQKTPTQ
jgi:micrococcal nuclease